MHAALAMVLAIGSIIGVASVGLGLTGGMGDGWRLAGGPGRGCQGPHGGNINGMHENCEDRMAGNGWNATYGACHNGTLENNGIAK